MRALDAVFHLARWVALGANVANFLDLNERFRAVASIILLPWKAL